MQRTVLELARAAAEHMGGRGIENARLEAELMLGSVLGLRRLDLYLQFDRPVAEDELERFRISVRRRLRGEPVQYILGEVEFRDIVLRVDRRALIPRPETEVLAGQVLAWAESRGTPSALDIGTGTGAIALSLAHEGRFGRIVATDVSAAALDLARENARRLGLLGQVEFREGETWAVIGREERFDVVVSNPPYVADSEVAALPREIRDWEPPEALYAADDGLAVLNALIDGAWARLEAGGLLALEIGLDQGDAVLARIGEHGDYERARLVPDLTGRDRVVLAERSRDSQQAHGTRGRGTP